MWRNYMVAAANILVSSFPLFMTWDPIVGICYCGISVLLLALLSWNAVGVFIVVQFILHAEKVPPNAVIAPILSRYVRHLMGKELKNQREPSLYYVDSKIPYYMPVSVRNAVVSLALEDRLERDGEGVLIRGMPKDAYVPKIIISRKAALLSLACYAVVIRIMEVWAILFAVTIRAIMALVMLIVSGALFGSAREMANAASFGSAIGRVIIKINDIAGCIQDKLVDFAMKITYANSYKFIEKFNQV